MERRNNVVDVSAFLLFEATGDSEADVGPAVENAVADDDAESCSWDLRDSGCVDENGDCGVKGIVDCSDDHHWDWDDDDDDDDDGDYDYDDVGGGVDCNEEGEATSCWNWRNGEMGMPQSEPAGRDDDHQRINVCAESANKKLKSEMEKNRLFWESCLAS